MAIWVDPAQLRGTAGRRYALDLSAALTVRLGLTIDIQLLNDAPRDFRYHALAGTPLVVRDRDAFDDLRARTWDEYFDCAPFARRHLREMLGA